MTKEIKFSDLSKEFKFFIIFGVFIFLVFMSIVIYLNPEAEKMSDLPHKYCEEKFIICYFNLENFDGNFNYCDNYTIGKNKEWGLPKIEYDCDKRWCTKKFTWEVCEIK